jgi:uroporphyrinogen decarboxylase
MTLAVQLMGTEAALYLAVDEPDTFARLLDRAADVITRYGIAQIEVGAHLPIVFNPSASPEIVPPPFFREFELPRLKRIFAAFEAAGALANWLHITGATGQILPYYPEAGVDIANLDYPVDVPTAMDSLPSTCLNGNIKPLAFVEGTRGDISAAADELLDLTAERGGFILSPGCEVPPEASPENVAAMVDAARQRA